MMGLDEKPLNRTIIEEEKTGNVYLAAFETSQGKFFLFFFHQDSIVWPFLAVFRGKREILRVKMLVKNKNKICFFSH